jgi:DNA processing protein
VHILSPNSSEYPELLRAIPQPPQSLYIKGRLDCLQQPLISVVGSRKLTGYGDLVLRTFIPKLVKAGLSIVSGLAYGADVRAHEIALQHKGTCIAVLGSGLDVIYPAVHQRIAETIQKEGGCIMSEHPPTMPPLPHHFPQRNRIISGLSRVTLVVQAGEKSGTVSTCNHALEQGREVCVVLADITREEYIWC